MNPVYARCVHGRLWCEICATGGCVDARQFLHETTTGESVHKAIDKLVNEVIALRKRVDALEGRQ